MTRRTLIPIVALLAAAGAAAARTPARVLFDDLRLERTELLGVDEGGVLLGVDGERTTRVALDKVVAVSVNAPAGLPALPPDRPGAVFVELVDGQRLVVSPEDGDDPETLAGDALGFGACRVPLERVARIARQGAPWRAPTPGEDEALLTNGDRLTGFVERVGREVVIETADGPVAVPLDRVAELRLANPPESPQGAGPRTLVTDDSGTTLLARTLRVGADGSVRVLTDPAAIGVDSRGEDAVAPDRPDARLLGLRRAAGATVRPIGHEPPERVSPTGGRRWAPAPAARPGADPWLMLADVAMPSPAEAVYATPAGADRFACEFRADAPGDWTDCFVRIHAVDAAGGRTLLGERRLTRAEPSGSLAADLDPGVRAVALSVDPGEHGAVQDAVVFGAPRLRVGR